MATKSRQRRDLAGTALIALGGLSLLGSAGFLAGVENSAGALILAGGGALLLKLYLQKPRQLWALLVGFALFGAAAAAKVSGALAGSAFLGLLGLGFFVAYRRHSRWWALIPAGVLWTLALVAGLEMLPGVDEGPVFFLGLAVTFGTLYKLPGGGKAWAAYPAIGAAVLAVVSGSFSGAWVLPLLLVGAGAYLLSQKADRSGQVKGAPSPNLADGASAPTQPSWTEVIAELEQPRGEKHAEQAGGSS